MSWDTLGTQICAVLNQLSRLYSVCPHQSVLVLCANTRPETRVCYNFTKRSWMFCNLEYWDIWAFPNPFAEFSLFTYLPRLFEWFQILSKQSLSIRLSLHHSTYSNKMNYCMEILFKSCIIDNLSLSSIWLEIYYIPGEFRSSNLGPQLAFPLTINLTIRLSSSKFTPRAHERLQPRRF